MLVSLSTCTDATIHHVIVVVGQIAHDEIHTRYLHITIQEQQPLILALVCQIVACGSTSAILFLSNKRAVGYIINLLILLYRFPIGRSIIHHDNLVGKTLWLVVGNTLTKPLQSSYHICADAVVCGNKYR